MGIFGVVFKGVCTSPKAAFMFLSGFPFCFLFFDMFLNRDLCANYFLENFDVRDDNTTLTFEYDMLLSVDNPDGYEMIADDFYFTLFYTHNGKMDDWGKADYAPGINFGNNGARSDINSRFSFSVEPTSFYEDCAADFLTGKSAILRMYTVLWGNEVEIEIAGLMIGCELIGKQFTNDQAKEMFYDPIEWAQWGDTCDLPVGWVVGYPDNFTSA